MPRHPAILSSLVSGLRLQIGNLEWSRHWGPCQIIPFLNNRGSLPESIFFTLKLEECTTWNFLQPLPVRLRSPSPRVALPKQALMNYFLISPTSLPIPPELNPVWPAKIPFLFGARAGGSLIPLVSATLVRAKVTPWISSVEGRWVPSHCSEPFHRAALAKAICRRWRSLVMRTNAEEAGRKTRNKGQLKAVWVDSNSTRIPQFQGTLLQIITPPKVFPKLDWQEHRRSKSPSPCNL